MNQLFHSKARQGAAPSATALDGVIAGIQTHVNTLGNDVFSQSNARSAFSMESIDQVAMQELDTSVKSLSNALESIGTEHNLVASKVQRDAAVVAGMLGGDIGNFLRQPVKHNVVSTESMVFIPANGGDVADTRMKQALEAYDEKENKNAVIYSVAYNLQAARQDEFGEAFFPTVVVTPDQVGFTVSIRLIQVYDEVRRQVSGKLDAFNKRNIIQAVIDPSILRNDTTKIVPVHRTESADKFVATSLLTPKTVLLEGESILTSALAVGKKLSLLGISQTEALLETGLQDSTDSIDTAVSLEAIYVQIGASVVRFNTLRLPTATFTYSVQGNYRQMTLNFSTGSLLVDKDTKTVGNVAVPELADLVTADAEVRLSVNISGTVNLELADTTVFASDLEVVSIFDNTNAPLPIDAGAGAALAALFAGAKVIGYDLDARRTNVNRRQRGQLLDTTFYNQVYAVPLRSPITVPRPLTVGDANDSSDLAALITATHIRTSNAAVDELLRVQDVLAEFVGRGGSENDTPEILGVARFLVRPFFEYAEVKVDEVVDSIKSHERAADIQAVLVNKLRDMAYRMYRDSGYKAAADALAGGVSQVPTVIIGTDPVLSRYLTVTGDLRTLGNDFNVRIVSTLNKRMTGKIVMSFGEFGAGKEGVPNPMHFGNMAWKPELTLVLPLHRNGANSKELTVQPSFLHITNLPIMASLDVSGIKDIVADKVSVNMHTVP
ncbi:hypothetical protein D3C71_77840 [compost metagenome]